MTAHLLRRIRSRATGGNEAASAVRGRSRVSLTVLAALLVAAFFPLVLTVALSLRSTSSIYVDFWQFQWPPSTANYPAAARALALPMLRTVLVCVASIAGILVLSCPCAYAFARLRFAGRQVAYRMVMGALLIPSVLLLTPHFALARGLGLVGTLWGLVVYYIATGLPLAVFLLTPFLTNQDEQIFEAARLDGARESVILVRIAVPLALPILATVAVMTFLNLYNDFIWPSLVLRQDTQTAIVALTSFAPPTTSGFSSRPDIGAQTSGYVIAAVPQLLVLALGMKYFVQGLTSGAIK